MDDKELEAVLLKAIRWAKRTLKKGDSLSVIRCPNTRRTLTFDHWEGFWIVSKSGIADIHPINIKAVNGKEIKNV